MDFCGSLIKNLPANAGDVGLIPGVGRSPGEGNGNPVQYSCLENPMYKGAWWATIFEASKDSDLTYQMNNNSNRMKRLFDNLFYFIYENWTV